MIVFVFENSQDAITSEELLKQQAIQLQVLPLPNSIQQRCGICLAIRSQLVKRVCLLLQAQHIRYRMYKQKHQQYNRIYNQSLAQMMQIAKHDVISIVGCGGKTSLFYTLAKELKAETVLLSTTTHMYPPTSDQVDLYINEDHDLSVLSPGRNYIAGYDQKSQKCKSLSTDDLLRWIQQADVTIIEADGSKGKPLKGYREDEPCVVKKTTVCIGVIPYITLDQMIQEQDVLRYPLFLEMAGLKQAEPIHEKHIVNWLLHPKGMFKVSCDTNILWINQIDTSKQMIFVDRIIQELRQRDVFFDIVIYGSLQNQNYHIYEY